MPDKWGNMLRNGAKESKVSSEQDYSWINHLQVKQKAMRKCFIIILATWVTRLQVWRCFYSTNVNKGWKRTAAAALTLRPTVIVGPTAADQLGSEFWNQSALLIADKVNVACEEAQRETERIDSTDNGWCFMAIKEIKKQFTISGKLLAVHKVTRAEIVF